MMLPTNTPVGVCYSVTQVIGSDAILVGDGVNLSGSHWRRHDTKTHSHIEDLVHLRLADPPTRLNQVKDWLRLR